MFWTIEKLESRLSELVSFRYRDSLCLSELRMKVDEAGENGAYPSEEGSW